MRLVTAAAVLATAFAACATLTPHPTEADAMRSGVPLARLEHGRQLFVARCGSCHQAPAPSSKSPAEWDSIVPEMLEHSNLDPQEGAEVLDFLKALSVVDARVAQR